MICTCNAHDHRRDMAATSSMPQIRRKRVFLSESTYTSPTGPESSVDVVGLGEYVAYGSQLMGYYSQTQR